MPVITFNLGFYRLWNRCKAGRYYHIEGINTITTTDIEFAKEFGYEIKLLGIAKKVKDGVEMRVHPTMIPDTSMLSHNLMVL